MPIQGPTRDHKEIRRWAAARQAFPVEVSPRVFDSEPAILKFVFGPEARRQEGIFEISWDSFFATFDLLGLSLVYDNDSHYELLRVEEKPDPRFDGRPFA